MDKIHIYQNEAGEEVKESTSQKALIFRNGKLLLAKNEHTYELCVPGGREGIDETKEATLIREIAEETGYKSFKLLNFKTLHKNSTIFRSPKDNQWRHINQEWNLCDVEVSDQIDPPKVIWADYENATSAFSREHEKTVLSSIAHLFVNK